MKESVMDVRLRLMFREEDRPFLLDVSSLFYDFELLHDFSLILCAEDYQAYRFSRYFWYRYGRPIKADHKLRVVRIVKESPLTIELVIAGIVAGSGALWILIQAIEKIRNWGLNREKLKLEVKKLRMENDKLQLELEQKAKERDAHYILGPLVRRLERIPMKLVDIEISVNEKDEDKFVFR
jgi:hypothetical protein